MGTVMEAPVAAPETGKKRVSKATVETAEDYSSVSWTFAGHDPVTVVVDEFTPLVKAYNLAYGFRQKLSDSYASAKTAEEAFQFFLETLEQLRRGEVSAPRGEREEPIDILVEAVIMRRIDSGIPTDDGVKAGIRSKIEAATKEGRAALRKAFAVEIAKIKAAKAPVQFEVGSILGEFA